MKQYNVVAAIIMSGPHILCVQRGPSKYDYISKKFEFPGGKQEENETREEALLREIKEELGINITIYSEFLVVDHTYQDFKLTMHSYLCKADSHDLHLTEHIDCKWLPASELLQLDWAAADLPIVKKLMSN